MVALVGLDGYSRPVPIGREPKSGWIPSTALNKWQISRLLPDFATLEGTVLDTKNGRCDLATAAVIRVRRSILQQGPGDFFRYLEVRQDRSQPPVRLLLVAFDWFPVAPEHLRLLARIIEARPGQPDNRTQQAATSLRDIADRAERRSRPIDWSFRAGPMADRRTGPCDYGQRGDA